jgi:CRISPR-associated protein Cmr1
MNFGDVPQMPKMMMRTHDIQFLTPAFLGNAEQDGQWRSPPFKALLRQWWRMVWAAERHFPVDHREMRQEEGVLFGAAADGAGTQSQVRLRLLRWDQGQLTQDKWPQKDPTVDHPEVPAKVGSALYLGFGPLESRKGQGTALKREAAVQVDERNQLRLAFPASHQRALDSAIQLIDAFGALGGRSRNGWGSLSVGLDEGASLTFPSREWTECLRLDWPHAIGQDKNGPLIWRTDEYADWPSLMHELARIKIEFRTHASFRFTQGHNASQPEARHWLSHPVTRHNVKAWKQGRLPNSLRFKARRSGNGRLFGLIFHVPHLPPPQFRPDVKSILSVWSEVHSFLDGNVQRATGFSDER